MNLSLPAGHLLRPATVTSPLCDLRDEPRPDCSIDTQLLLGDVVNIVEENEGWARVQSRHDHYVGWTASSALGQGIAIATHRVISPRTMVYLGPDLRLPMVRALSMGSRLDIVGEALTRGTRYALLQSGEALAAGHLALVNQHENDFVEAARRLLGTPYLWGGNSAFGLDCSALVQLAMRMCGREVLRDTDMQAATIGTVIDPGPGFSQLIRGDLVFWQGHVGIFEGDGNIVHASGHTMLVTSEPLVGAISRIAGLYGQPTVYRRP